MTAKNLVEKLKIACETETVMEIHVEGENTIVRDCFVPQGVVSDEKKLRIWSGHKVINIADYTKVVYDSIDGYYIFEGKDANVYMYFHAS